MDHSVEIVKLLAHYFTRKIKYVKSTCYITDLYIVSCFHETFSSESRFPFFPHCVEFAIGVEEAPINMHPIFCLFFATFSHSIGILLVFLEMHFFWHLKDVE